jgi:MSHA pilin protein MshC
LLRYAQKAAVAQRRTVCVGLNANGVVLTIAGTTGANACDTALVLPNSNLRGGVLLAAKESGVPVATFHFLSLGGTDQANDVTINIANATGTIIVDHTTGYVY